MDAIFFLFFFLIAGFIVYNFIKIISRQIQEKQKNDDAPILDIPVIVVEKRVETKTSSRTNRNNHTTHSSYNIYKITFEHLHNGNRHTFSMDEPEFNQIIEEDIGYLTYQRKRYHYFTRDFMAGNEVPSQTNTNTQGDVPLKIE
ncbi:DUF2500 domain-containing protein [Kordia sp.]|uniref:DUF2500 domain-containing protein n=1 Tax=Kordia sp. TaxID=1965332 RepID=UPI003B5B8BAD